MDLRVSSNWSRIRAIASREPRDHGRIFATARGGGGVFDLLTASILSRGCDDRASARRAFARSRGLRPSIRTTIRSTLRVNRGGLLHTDHPKLVVSLSNRGRRRAQRGCAVCRHQWRGRHARGGRRCGRDPRRWLHHRQQHHSARWKHSAQCCKNIFFECSRIHRTRNEIQQIRPGSID